MNKNFTLLFVFVSLAALILSACGAQVQSPLVWPTATLSPQQQVQLNQACSVGNPVGVRLEADGQVYPCPEIAATTTGPAATAMPGATPAAPNGACTGYTVVQETPFGHKPGGPVINNMDVGDGSLYAVVQAWDRNDPATTFHALINRGNNLDFERPTIAGTYFYLSGSFDAVTCRANQMWTEAGSSAYRLYIGPGTPPAGWKTEFPSGWEMKTWTFIETPITVEGSTWDTVTVQIGDSKHIYGNDNVYVYGQLWDGKNASRVYHFVTEPDWKFSAPNYQGTVWTVSGGDPDILVARFMQMTSEVVLRDDRPTVVQYYCGAGDPPAGWNVPIGSGWSCKKQ